MKKIFLILIVGLLASCSHTYVTFNDLTPSEYGKFIRTQNYSSTYSPTEYNVVKGFNPANEYNWQQIIIVKWTKQPFKYYYFKGDDSQLVRAYFPDADVIMSYAGIYFVGFKKE